MAETRQPRPGKRPLLLYAGSCPKCRFLSWLVVALSLGVVRRVPLERPEWKRFYEVDHPEARGYPVLFRRGRPVLGARVFWMVPVVLIETWVGLVAAALRGRGVAGEIESMTDDAARQDTVPALAAELCRGGAEALLAQWTDGFPEAVHELPFPRSQGFLGPDDVQAGNVFQRAWFLDVLCDLRGARGGGLDAEITREVEYLIAARRTTGVGGWGYFPGLRELPPDADDLAQVLLGFVRAGRADAARAYCDPPLRVLLLENAHPDGSFESWIIPTTRDAEQELQLRWVNIAWGAGPDAEVIANLLHALRVYDARRYEVVIDRGARYLRTRQAGDGSWASTWYHGPYYGTWVALRLLTAVQPNDPAVARGLDFLRRTQHPDGGWGEGGRSDPLNTAFALLGLATAPTPDDAAAARALRLLVDLRTPGGMWAATPFIRMDLGRPTGRVRQTLTYGSATVTTAVVLKAALAWAARGTELSRRSPCQG